jgi:serine/threonine protein kinase
MDCEDILPNIVAFYGDYRYQGTLNLVLEFVEGVTLETLYNEPQPEPTEMLSFWKSFADVFNPLSRIHAIKQGGRVLTA